MGERLTCEAVEQGALIARYLGGQLDRAEEEALEAHYLTCARCQHDIRLAAGLRRSLTDPRARSQRRRFLWVGGGLAAAACVWGVLLLRPAPDSDALRRLGGVLEPPAYLGVQVRAIRSPADSLLQVAMEHYLAQRYGEAGRALTAALAVGADSLVAEFFLASSLLMERQPREASAAYRRVIARGETPYLPEARFYLAKALLQLGRGQEALAQLRLGAQGDDLLAVSARALADSVEGVIAR